eukprot:5776907-Prorocentrum_lima.AAC.1
MRLILLSLCMWAALGMSVVPGQVHVMMNGLPGAMGREVGAACLRKGFRLAPTAFTGPDVSVERVEVGPELDGAHTTSVKLVKVRASTFHDKHCLFKAEALRKQGPPNDLDACREAVAAARAQLQADELLIAIDYTHPSAVNHNAA